MTPTDRKRLRAVLTWAKATGQSAADIAYLESQLDPKLAERVGHGTASMVVTNAEEWMAEIKEAMARGT